MDHVKKKYDLFKIMSVAYETLGLNPAKSPCISNLWSYVNRGTHVTSVIVESSEE